MITANLSVSFEWVGTFHLKVSFSTIRNPWIQLTKSPGGEIGSLGSGCCVPHRCGRFIDPRRLQWASSSVARFWKQTLLRSFLVVFSHVFTMFFLTCVLIPWRYEQPWWVDGFFKQWFWSTIYIVLVGILVSSVITSSTSNFLPEPGFIAQHSCAIRAGRRLKDVEPTASQQVSFRWAGTDETGELARTISTQALACRSWSQWSLS